MKMECIHLREKRERYLPVNIKREEHVTSFLCDTGERCNRGDEG